MMQTLAALQRAFGVRMRTSELLLCSEMISGCLLSHWGVIYAQYTGSASTVTRRKVDLHCPVSRDLKFLLLALPENSAGEPGYLHLASAFSLLLAAWLIRSTRKLSKCAFDDQWRCRGSLPGFTDAQSCNIPMEAENMGQGTGIPLDREFPDRFKPSLAVAAALFPMTSSAILLNQ